MRGVSLVALIVKNLPAVQETRVRSLVWEDPWRREWLPTPYSSLDTEEVSELPVFVFSVT